MEYYLRIEAVNLANFISDTMDISTIRGGGLLLLNSIEEIEKRFKQFKAISTGASSGLFSFEIADIKKAKNLQQQVVDFLSRDKRLKHATFVIDILQASEDFNKDKEKLLALNRWQQMQYPTVIYPPSSDNIKFLRHKRPVCDIDNIRPLIKKIGKKEYVSESVYQRRQYGRWLKQAFYQRHTGLKKLPSFVNDLTELTTDDDKKHGNLHHKMAVIYLDGNGFGNIQQKICQGDDAKDALELFDIQIKDYRLNFLLDLLEDTVGKTQWIYKHKHRLETLLWGGDEIILVVPAWLGWWTLCYFFQKSKSWNVDDSNPEVKEPYQLTHAAGLVFCHHNAPIHRITELAKDLAELAKDKKDDKGNEIGREASYVAYQVLESFDYVTGDLEEFRNKRCGESGLKSSDLMILGNHMDKVLNEMEPMERVKRAIPKGKVYDIVQTLLSDPIKANELIEKTADQLTVTVSRELKELYCCFGSNHTFWLHLIELWDYIEPLELTE